MRKKLADQKMFKAARWKSEKINKIDAVFKFQFKAKQIPHPGWEELMVSLLPVDSGKPTARTEKAAVVDGSSNWATPVYESVKLIQDLKTGKINEKAYLFILSSTGSLKLGVLGDSSINLADYVEAFKPSSVSLLLNAPNAETILHITVQRVQSEAEGRGLNEDGDTSMRLQRITLKSELENSEMEGNALAKSYNGIKDRAEISHVNSPVKMKFSYGRTMTVQVKSNGNLIKSNSLDAISASGSDTSSGYTPKENGAKNNISQQEYGSILSPLSSTDTPRDPVISSAHDWSIVSAAYGSLDGSSSTSGEALLREGSQESDNNTVEKHSDDVIVLTRQLEVSNMELQTLRKQVVKESRRGHDLARLMQNIKDERDALERECAEFKALRNRAIDDEHFSSKLQFGGKDIWSILEETKQELNHEKRLNESLHLQLNKINESNAELIHVVKDLEELLQQKNGECSSDGCSGSSINPDVMKDLEEVKFKFRLAQQLQSSESLQDSLETSIHVEDEQYSLDVLVKKPGNADAFSSPDQKMAHLITELELYKKEREEIEMQMEQLALDYEILKQENHDVSKKLEQIQLREQLRMQFDCSTHFASVSELEAQIESLENEIARQAEAFQADLEILSRAKTEQEKRAIQAEEELRNVRRYSNNTAEQLQTEFKRLTEHMSSTFSMNERLVLQVLQESSELQLQKCHLEEMLEKKNKELVLVKQQHNIKFQQLLSLVDLKTKEADSLLSELKEKRKELENKRLGEESRQKASSEKIARLTTEMEMLSRKSESLCEQIKIEENLTEEMNQLKTSMAERNVLLQICKKEKSMHEPDFSFLKEEAKMPLKELNDLMKINFENDASIRNPDADVTLLIAQYDGMKHSLFKQELEQENLLKEASLIDIIEKKLEDYNPEFKKSSARSKISISTRPQHVFHESARINGDYAIKHVMEGKKKIKDLSSIGTPLIISNIDGNSEILDDGSICCTYEQEKASEVYEEMEGLREQNRIMETELEDLQQRYSEVSLKFAEVEGERQQLVIKVRSLKSSLTIV